MMRRLWLRWFGRDPLGYADPRGRSLAAAIEKLPGFEVSDRFPKRVDAKPRPYQPGDYHKDRARSPRPVDPPEAPETWRAKGREVRRVRSA